MKKLGMVLIAGVMSFGLTGCIDDLFGDSTSCEFITNCSGGGGYSCDAEPVSCWSTIEQCQQSANCD